MRCRSDRNEVVVVRNSVKSILAAVLTLTVITATVVAALGFTDLLTKEAIAEQAADATTQACRAVMPSADTFVGMDVSALGEDTVARGVLAVYMAKKGDTLCGYVVKTSTNGKSSGLEVMTGISLDGVVMGVEVVANGETAGYVDTVIKGGLLKRLIGVKDNASAVDGVSQATKTSNGIKNGVSLALQVYKEVTASEW